jgi:hypothetical protein
MSEYDDRIEVFQPGFAAPPTEATLGVGQTRPFSSQEMEYLAGLFELASNAAPAAVRSALSRDHLEASAPDAWNVTGLTEGQAEADASVFLNKRFSIAFVDRIGHGVNMEQSLHFGNMQNVVGMFKQRDHALVMGLSSKGSETTIFMGASRTSDEDQGYAVPSSEVTESLCSVVSSNFPGTTFKRARHAGTLVPHPHVCDVNDYDYWISSQIDKCRYVAALTGAPSVRGESGRPTVQSLDRLIHGLDGRNYLYLTIAEPVPAAEISAAIRHCEQLVSEIHGLVKSTESISRSLTDSQADTRGTQTTHGINTSDTKTLTKASAGALLGPGIATAIGLGTAFGSVFVPALALEVVRGMSFPMGQLISAMAGRKQTAHGVATVQNEQTAENQNLTMTLGTTQGRTANRERLDKSAERCETQLNEFIARLDRARVSGLWRVGAYFLADDPHTFELGQSLLSGLYSGDKTVEPMRTVPVSIPVDGGGLGGAFLDPAARARIKENLRHVQGTLGRLRNLKASRTSDEAEWNQERLANPLGDLFEGLSTPLTADELARLVELPRREVPGIRLQPTTDFGRNPVRVPADDAIRLAHLVVDGDERSDRSVDVAASEFARHAFVTGFTGTGKTTTLLQILKSFDAGFEPLDGDPYRVPFLVLEPAGDEYRRLLKLDQFRAPEGGRSRLRVFTLGNEDVVPFRYSPFRFVPGVSLTTHIEMMMETFSAAWPMYPPLPFILRRAIDRSYSQYGWDLRTGKNPHVTVDMTDTAAVRAFPRLEEYLPTLDDLYANIDPVADEMKYQGEVSVNSRAALKARISSLMEEGKGNMLNVRYSIPFETIFDSPCVLEMESMVRDEQKCLMMGLILSQLYQHRRVQYRERNTKRDLGEPEQNIRLRHVTVFEEAHRLLRRPESLREGGDVQAKAVETFSNMIAEIRKYGEGFIIADQTPSKIVPDVLKNTSIKIAHRLPSRDDREALGQAMGMTPEQSSICAQLMPGEAIFHSEGQHKPLWIKTISETTQLDAVSDFRLQSWVVNDALELGEKEEIARMKSAERRKLPSLYKVPGQNKTV